MLIDPPTSFIPLAYAEKMAARGNLDVTYEQDAWTYYVEPAACGTARVLVYDDGVLIGALMATYTVELSAYAEARPVVTIDADDEIDAKQYAVEGAPASAEQWEIVPSASVRKIEPFSVYEEEVG